LVPAAPLEDEFALLVLLTLLKRHLLRTEGSRTRERVRKGHPSRHTNSAQADAAPTARGKDALWGTG
jgi:hypothetical protein